MLAFLSSTALWWLYFGQVAGRVLRSDPRGHCRGAGPDRPRHLHLPAPADRGGNRPRRGRRRARDRAPEGCPALLGSPGRARRPCPLPRWSDGLRRQDRPDPERAASRRRHRAPRRRAARRRRRRAGHVGSAQLAACRARDRRAVARARPEPPPDRGFQRTRTHDQHPAARDEMAQASADRWTCSLACCSKRATSTISAIST